MSTNFNTYQANTKRVAMNVADLEVGQTLVRIFRPRQHFGDFKIAEYKVKAILKTRLVLEAVDAGVNGSRVELRMLLENSRYSSWRTGEVKTDREGETQSYSREPYEFATAGDPIIEELREHYAALKNEQEIKNAAKAAVAEIRQNLDYPSIEKIDAAIAALTALRATLPTE